MSDLRVGMEVSTTTHFNKDARGTGVLIGVEVADRERPGHLIHELDPLKANQLLIGLDDEYDYWPRIVVKCFDEDGKIQDMFGSTILCFYKSDNVTPTGG